MFTTIQPGEIAANSDLVRQGFELRKRVFADQLGWNVPVRGNQERDSYDDIGPSYLVWCSDDRKVLYGLIRLMPTDGPTLLHDVFHATHGRDPALKQAAVWEGTRMCLNEARIARDFPSLSPAQGLNLLLLALCEAALALGISRLVANFEPCMSRIYRRAGLAYHLHGRAEGYGAHPVYCASFEVSSRVLAAMRARIGIDQPVFCRSAAFRRIETGTDAALMPVAA